MSNLSNFIVAGFFACAAGGDSLAEVQEVANTAPRAIDLKDGEALEKAQAKAAKSEPGKLRCWQSGRLVFEGRGVIPTDTSLKAPEIHIRNGRSEVRVFDMKDALCVLEYVEGNSGAAK